MSALTAERKERWAFEELSDVRIALRDKLIAHEEIQRNARVHAQELNEAIALSDPKPEEAK